MAAFLGAALGVLFTICFATGLYSHLQQHPQSWLPIPARPAGLYRFTQGLHVAAGIASVPVLIAKLWVVWPRFVAWPPVRSVAHLVERAGLFPLVAGGIYLAFSGVANIAQWYPWRFSFMPDGEIVIADVGQNQYEEVNVGVAGNYGWPCWEGLNKRASDPRCDTGTAMPVLTKTHGGDGFCSITGGYVVRDPGLPTLFGRYVYGDYCNDALRSVVLPAGTGGGKRKDGRDIIAAFRAKGHPVVRDTAELKAASGARLLGLFAVEDMDFEVDRDASKEPSTAEMAAAALKALSQGSPNGFVLLVENENIDTAAHANDAASLMRALWAFDDAVKVALEYQRRHPGTLVIVTGDHETGGFSPTYALKDLSTLSSKNRFYSGDEQLRMLERITLSLGRAKEILGRKPSGEALDKLIAEHFPGFRLDPDLRQLVLGRKTDERNFAYLPQNALGRMVARETGYYWGTGGHTPEPVAVGAIGPGAELFRGYQDNTDFGKHLHRLISGK